MWLLEHPPLYTAGTSRPPGQDLLGAGPPARLRRPRPAAANTPGHGPGQRVAYLMLDLRARGRDVRCLVQGLEEWMIRTRFRRDSSLSGERRDGRIGVWSPGQPGRPGRQQDRRDRRAGTSKWSDGHPRHRAQRLPRPSSHYDGIVPCGIADRGVTSLEDLGQIVSHARGGHGASGPRSSCRFGPTVDLPHEALVTAASTPSS